MFKTKKKELSKEVEFMVELSKQIIKIYGEMGKLSYRVNQLENKIAELEMKD